MCQSGLQKNLSLPERAGTCYLDTLEQWLFLQLEEHELRKFIFQKDDAPPYWHNKVRDKLNITELYLCFGQKAPTSHSLSLFGTASMFTRPDVRRFIPFGLYEVSCVFDLLELRNRIEAAVATTSAVTRIKIWDELGSRLDVCNNAIAKNLIDKRFSLRLILCSILNSCIYWKVIKPGSNRKTKNFLFFLKKNHEHEFELRIINKQLIKKHIWVGIFLSIGDFSVFSKFKF